jgi:hypothetical protein
LNQLRFLQAWEPANGGLCGELGVSHGGRMIPITMLDQ